MDMILKCFLQLWGRIAVQHYMYYAIDCGCHEFYCKWWRLVSYFRIEFAAS
ncbi:hypothetical protein SLEP1_g28139 [Rubroshorea leprosula]|uniref:Uncharacterized protein n=1 Tax=Rubroshorea leprosula TaxID=152421 RepID=A0AAV5JYR8_9ROSI|nr:hypothetical protein SLEP1_g28139 [Rubroshorea leprosula]